MRGTLLLAPLLLAVGLLAPNAARAHNGTIPTAFGTPTIDGVRGVGEWSAATPIPAFPAFPGSLIYVMDDAVNLYIALYMPDPTLDVLDHFWTRIDSQHDGIASLGDDEVIGGPFDYFFDSHFAGTFWALQDSHYDGVGDGGAIPGGNFIEVSHPLNSGDPQDVFVYQGDTIGLCFFYALNGTLLGSTVFPENCHTGGASQSLYIDYTTTSGTVGVPTSAPLPRSGIALRPNPTPAGGILDIQLPPGSEPVTLALYSISGSKVAHIGSVSGGGSRTLRWQLPDASNRSITPGLYFVRATTARGEWRSARLVVQ
jgi:hypothetical protein